VLSEAKVFINAMVAYSTYVNDMRLFGSNDNWTTSVLIDTFGANVHGGWNYLDFSHLASGLRPTYNSYKITGTAKSCRVTEFKLSGVQTFVDNNPTYTCTP